MTAPLKYQVARRQSATVQMFLSLFRLLRLVFVCTFMLLVALVFIVYTFNHALLPRNGGAFQNATMQSPLQSLLTKEQSLQEELRDSDCELLKKINDRSTLEVKTLVIAETVVPYEDREKLGTFILKQLESSDVISADQASALAAMVNVAPMEASVTKEETGQTGTLRNSALLTLIKRNDNNVHFMMVGVRVEPRLGWRWISHAERNSWNSALSRILLNKVRLEAQNYLWQRTLNELHNVVKHHAKNQLAMESLLPEKTSSEISDQ
ncbi:hypothetical protein R1flu_015552 [Riccia fluitans]|uniref:ATP synthase protein MI25 n=1 Tax=Riccia fluitans TaxID=41844 RepID=A0ABD1YJB4_9MARC